jgi:DNA repair protein RecN (Recombination protein N)
MDAIHSAARKFRVPEELPAEHAKLAERLSQMADASDIEGLRSRRKSSRPLLAEAQKLSATRTRAAQQLGEAVTRPCRI